MYDALTSTYALSCPHTGEARLRLSAFRTLERMPGPTAPAVYSVVFACPCGEEHTGLVAHDELDVAPLGLGASTTFVNLMTTREEPVAEELSELAASRIGAGEWPWSFYCYLEGRSRPVTPSAFARIAPGLDQPRSAVEARFAVAVHCPCCSSTSVNVVSRQHVDVPFWNDPSVAVVDHVFPDDVVRIVDDFREELASARFDEKRLHLGG